METPPVGSTGSKRTLPATLSKSTLTPCCRRPGLSRPSSSGLNKSCHMNVVGTPIINVQEAIVKNKCKSSGCSSLVENTPKLNCAENSKVGSNCAAGNKQSVVRKVRRCLTVASRTPLKVKSVTGDLSEIVSDRVDNQCHKKIKLSLELIGSDKEVGKCDSLDSSSNNFFKTDNSDVQTQTMVEVDDPSEKVTSEIIEKLLKSIQEKKKKLEQLKVQEAYAKKHDLEELRAQTAKWKRAGREALEYSLSLAKHAGYSVTTQQLMSQHGFPRHLMGYNSEDDEFV